MGYVARLHFFVSRNRIAAPVLTPPPTSAIPRRMRKEISPRESFFLFSVLPFPRRLPRLSKPKARRIAVKICENICFFRQKVFLSAFTIRDLSPLYSPNRYALKSGG